MAKAKRKAKATKAKASKNRKKPAKRAKARKSQRFTVSHHREEDFDQGLRAYSAYRDLGIAPATGGLVQAHVIRMTKPFSADEVLRGRWRGMAASLAIFMSSSASLSLSRSTPGVCSNSRT